MLKAFTIVSDLGLYKSRIVEEQLCSTQHVEDTGIFRPTEEEALADAEKLIRELMASQPALAYTQPIDRPRGAQ